jgi:hypothetical protein
MHLLHLIGAIMRADLVRRFAGTPEAMAAIIDNLDARLEMFAGLHHGQPIAARIFDACGVAREFGEVTREIPEAASPPARGQLSGRAQQISRNHLVF